MMRLLFPLLFVFIAACASPSLYQKKPAFYSYLISDVDSDGVELEQNADVYATPASCQKSITSLLALKILGADYTFETKLYQAKNNEALISFSGDPSLSGDSLKKLLTPLSNHVWNKIYIDES